jgi:predicted dienelactone hydrolase
VLIIGSTQNDFLPYERHAGYYAATIPAAQSLIFDQGEGHFVYLDRCKHAYQAMGVALCTDRPGVDRNQVHQKAAALMLKFIRGSEVRLTLNAAGLEPRHL